MAKTYVLINIEAGKARWKWIYNQLSKVTGVKSVDALTGSYDFIVELEGENFNAIWQTVLEELQSLEGLTNTTTCNVISL